MYTRHLIVVLALLAQSCVSNWSTESVRCGGDGDPACAPSQRCDEMSWPGQGVCRTRCRVDADCPERPPYAPDARLACVDGACALACRTTSPEDVRGDCPRGMRCTPWTWVGTNGACVVDDEHIVR